MNYVVRKHCDQNSITREMNFVVRIIKETLLVTTSSPFLRRAHKINTMGNGKLIFQQLLVALVSNSGFLTQDQTV